MDQSIPELLCRPEPIHRDPRQRFHHRMAEGIVTVDVLVNGNKDVKLVDAETRDEIEVAVSIPFAQAGVGFYAAMFSDVDLTANCIFERE